MTTILGLRTKEAVYLGSDTQLSYGHLKYPFGYQKILSVGENVLIASTGSVGSLQNLLRISLQNLQIAKIVANSEDLSVTAEELAREISQLSFSLSLEHKNFEPYSYMIAGNNDLISVGYDGSTLNIPNYLADGSGMELALSVLNSGYHENLTEQEAILLIFQALKSSSHSDIFTNDDAQVFKIDKKGISVCQLKEVEEPVKEITKEDKNNK